MSDGELGSASEARPAGFRSPVIPYNLIYIGLLQFNVNPFDLININDIMMITLKRLLMMMTAAGGELEAKKSLQKRGRAPGGQESRFLIAFEDEDDEEDEEDDEDEEDEDDEEDEEDEVNKSYLMIKVIQCSYLVIKFI